MATTEPFRGRLDPVIVHVGEDRLPPYDPFGSPVETPVPPPPYEEIRWSKGSPSCGDYDLRRKVTICGVTVLAIGIAIMLSFTLAKAT